MDKPMFILNDYFLHMWPTLGVEKFEPYEHN
jgi:hypothetical protein